MEISDDKRTAQVVVNATLDAPGVETLIRKLSLLRAQMEPAVPLTREGILISGQDITVEDKPSIVMAKRANGGFRLWLRHRGVGWIAYELEAADALRTAKYVISRSDDDDGIDLVTHDEPHRH